MVGILLVALACAAVASAQGGPPGPVRIYDTIYEKVDPGPEFKPAPAAAEDWEPPKPTLQERRSGLIVFTRPEPFDIKPWSRPRPDERLAKFSHFAARGQTTNLWFAVFALEFLKNLTITVEPSRGERDRSTKSAWPIFRTRLAHFWAQRTDWRGRTFYVVPELLLPVHSGKALFPAKGGTLQELPLDIPDGQCRLFWLQTSVPDRAKPGIYRFTITVQASQKAPLRLPLTVRVLPIRLLKPAEKRWLLYSDSWFLGNLPDEKLLSVVKEVADVGIDGLTELPFGKLDLDQLKAGKVFYDPEPLLRWQKLMSAAGLRGPHTIGAFVEDQAAAALGVTVDLNKEWDTPLTNAMRLISQTVVRQLRAHPFDWLFYGWDEPGPENLRAIQQYRFWREGGAKTYVTFYQRGTYDVAGQWMTHPCFSVGLINRKETADWARTECDKRGQSFFWYGSGCYLGQEGRMFPNRYLTGWLFWKTRADGQVSWTFIRPHEDPFNDFDGVHANSVEPKDQCTVYPQLNSPNDYRTIVGIISTIQWEAIREGITDYRYGYTLKNLIDYVRQICAEARRREAWRWSQRLHGLADESEAVLRLIEDSVPWGNEVGSRGYTNEDLERVRFILAQQIDRLVRALQGDELVQMEREPRRVFVRVQVLPAESHGLTVSVPLPVIAVPKLKAPPQVDGQVGQTEWLGAAVAEPFHHYQTGQTMPEKIGTKALVGFDERHLYVAFICLEPNPGRMKKGFWARDSDGVWQEESVEVFIAPYDDPKHYGHIVVNAAGSFYDEMVFDVGWNPDVSVGTAVGPDRWLCEIAIPWASLPFIKKDRFPVRSIRINFCRNRSQEDQLVTHWAWSPTFGWFHTPERFGIGLFETGGIVVNHIRPPRYFGEKHATITLQNHTDQTKRVQVNGLQVTLSPLEIRRVQLPVPASTGLHRKVVQLRWDGSQRTIELRYAIPEAIVLVSPVVLANEHRQALLTVGVHLSPELFRKAWLIIEADDKLIRLPLTSPSPEFSLTLRGTSTSLRLRLEGIPAKWLIARLFLPDWN